MEKQATVKKRRKFFSNKYCNNCNVDGHSYKDCLEPIVSYGVICYRETQDKTVEYLVIKRLNSFAFTDFIRGRYHHDDLPYISLLLSRMTILEHEYINTLPFDILWARLWKQNITKHCKEYEMCKNIYNTMLKRNLLELIKQNKAVYDDSEWGFPKGKRNVKEMSIECAKREFEEETGVSSTLILMDGEEPVVENFTNINNKSYRSIYYTAKYIGNQDIALSVDQTNANQCTEIEDLCWVKYEDAVNLFRHYYTGKLKCLEHVHNIFKKRINNEKIVTI